MKYIITVKEVHNAKWAVEADSPEEAKRVYEDGGTAEFVDGSLEFIDTLTDDNNVVDGRYRVEAGLEEEDECPNCQNGTLEDQGDMLACRGECGQLFKKRG